MFFNIEYEIYLTPMAVFLIFSLCTSENFKHPATLMNWIQYPASEHELSSLEIRGHKTKTGKTSCYAFLAGHSCWHSVFSLATLLTLCHIHILNVRTLLIFIEGNMFWNIVDINFICISPPLKLFMTSNGWWLNCFGSMLGFLRADTTSRQSV